MLTQKKKVWEKKASQRTNKNDDDVHLVALLLVWGSVNGRQITSLALLGVICLHL